jgi:hypothetical protein
MRRGRGSIAGRSKFRSRSHPFQRLDFRRLHKTRRLPAKTSPASRAHPCTNCSQQLRVTPVIFPRCVGIVLQVTSLPGGHGIGDLGKSAYEFVRFLADAANPSGRSGRLGCDRAPARCPGLGSEARMNLPRTVEGNWRWRFKQHDLTKQIRQRLLRCGTRPPQGGAGPSRAFEV